MRLNRLFVIVVIILSTLSSCSFETDINNVSLSETEKNKLLQHIFEISYQEYADGTNHVNTISPIAEYSIDTNAPENKTIQFLGTECSISYVETIFFPLGDFKVHRYALTDDEDCRILLMEDNSVYAVSGAFAVIDIPSDASSDTVKAAVEPVVSQWLDPSNYANVQVEQGISINGSFGYYKYIYYNDIQGYRTNWASVFVNDNGEIISVQVSNIPINTGALEINESLATELLELKLRSIFDTKSTSFLDYYLSADAQIVMYSGELCAYYPLSVQYYGTQYGNEMELTTACDLLIPIDLLTAE